MTAAGDVGVPAGAQAIRGSIAEAAFVDALALLAEHPPAPARVGIPYEFVVGGPAGASGGRGPVPGVPAPGVPVPGVLDLSDAGSGPGPDAGPLHRAAHDLRRGALSATGLVAEALEWVAEHDDDLHGIVELTAESARAEAAAADRAAAAGRWLGPLHGIPITVKDVIDVAGVPTRCGSLAYHEVPTADAVGVARLRAAGAIVIGKAATHEFALGVTCPQSRNPRDPSRIPGGSSGGSAVAVATGMGLASLGTDTRASIRVPAALSGTVGFKPTYGRIPTDGVVSLSWTMDHVAPMASTVADAALVMEMLLADGRPLASVPAGVDGLRVGVVRAAFADASAGVVDVVESAIELLGTAGGALADAAAPDGADLALANAAGLVVSRVEAAAFHRSMGLDLDLYWEEVADQLRAAMGVSGVDYVDAQRRRGLLARRLLAVFDDVDVLVMPTSPVVAPPVDDFADYLMLLSRNAIPWSFVGFPAISVPCGLVDGLPVGLQVVAPPYREDLLVAVGGVVEGRG